MRLKNFVLLFYTSCLLKNSATYQTSTFFKNEKSSKVKFKLILQNFSPIWYHTLPFLNMDFESTIGVKHSAAKLNGRMLQKIPRINKKSPEFRIDFMVAYRYNLGT